MDKSEQVEVCIKLVSTDRVAASDPIQIKGVTKDHKLERKNFHKTRHLLLRLKEECDRRRQKWRMRLEILRIISQVGIYRQLMDGTDDGI